MQADIKTTPRAVLRARQHKSNQSPMENAQAVQIPLMPFLPEQQGRLLPDDNEGNTLRLVENVKRFLGQFFKIKEGKLTREKNAYAKVLVAHFCTGLSSHWCATNLGLDPVYKKNACRKTVLVRIITSTAYHCLFLQLVTALKYVCTLLVCALLECICCLQEKGASLALFNVPRELSGPHGQQSVVTDEEVAAYADTLTGMLESRSGAASSYRFIPAGKQRFFLTYKRWQHSIILGVLHRS